MNLTSRCRAFGGLPLEGHKLVRLTFMDEGGTSKREPYAVVSAVLIDADRLLIQVEDYLDCLVEKHIPAPDRDGFVFHSTDIWSGSRYFKNRDEWPLPRRLDILRDLVAIPARFEIPVAFGFVEKASYPDQKPHSATPQELDTGAHAVAFALCLSMIERAMRSRWPEEITVLILEDRQKVKDTIKETLAHGRNKKLQPVDEVERQYLPITRIRDTPHFATKKQSRHLQLADVCAFFIRGHLSGHPKVGPFFSALEPCLLGLSPGTTR